MNNQSADRTPLDEHVRRTMLRWPSISATRWDVLRHLFIVCGNGYEWEGGRLVDDTEDPFDEARARFEFFDDIHRLNDEMARVDARVAEHTGNPDYVSPLAAEREAEYELALNRRTFMINNLDRLAVERVAYRTQPRLTLTDLHMISPGHSAMFTVPDDAEPSYRDGAVEVLRVVLYDTQFMPADDPRVAACRAALDRLDPPPTEEQQAYLDGLLDEALAEDRGCE